MQAPHIVIAVLAGWGVGIYGASIYNKSKKEAAAAQAAAAPPAEATK
jgi:hypothetical protein